MNKMMVFYKSVETDPNWGKSDKDELFHDPEIKAVIGTRIAVKPPYQSNIPMLYFKDLETAHLVHEHLVGVAQIINEGE